MKKLVYLFVILCSQVSWGQLHYEDFNDSLAQGYTLDTLVGTYNNLAFQQNFITGGSDLAMYSWSVDPNFGPQHSDFDDWLITPPLVLSQDQFLEFQTIAFGDDMGDVLYSAFEVLISTTGSSQLDFTNTEMAYQFTAASQLESFSLDLSAYTGSTIHIAFRNLCEGTYGMFWDNIVISNQTETDASISFETHADYASIGSTDFYYKLKHVSLDSIFYADIYYQVDNGVINQNTYNGNQLYNGDDTVMNFSASLLTDGIHDLKIWIDNVNYGLDINQLNDTAHTQIVVTSSLIPQNILFEEATGTWCGPCQVILPEIEQFSTYPDFIPVALHTGDIYEISDGNNLFGTFGLSGVPSSMFNRAQSIGPDFPQENDFFKYSDVWDSIYNIMSGNILTPIEIIVEHSHVPGSPKLGFAQGKIISHAPIISDLALHLFLTEDSLVGGGGPQNAVLRSVPLGVNGDQILLQNISNQDTIEFTYQYDIADEINIENLNLVAFVETFGTSNTDRTVLQAVQVREILLNTIAIGDIYGPDTVFMNANNAYFCNAQNGASYNWTVETQGTITNTQGTAVLVNWNQPGLTTLTLEIVIGSQSILLTKEVYVIGGLGINTESFDFTVYPNPTTGAFSVQFGADISTAVVAVYTLDGKLVNSVNLTSTSTEFDFGLAAGSYVVVVTDGEHTARRKLIVQ